MLRNENFWKLFFGFPKKSMGPPKYGQPKTFFSANPACSLRLS